jgi:holo-[acyl-carrier protein] synthase
LRTVKNGIGIDLIEVERIQKAVTHWDDRFLHRIFLPQELAYCLAKVRVIEHLAVRFAAKEAAFKALGLPAAGWHDFWVESEGSMPRLFCSSRVLNHRPHLQLMLSLSHTHEHAVAVVLAEWEEES